MVKALEELVPKAAAAAPPPNYDPTSAIDLSNAQNEVLRPELQEFFKTTIEDKLSEKASPITHQRCILIQPRPLLCPTRWAGTWPCEVR